MAKPFNDLEARAIAILAAGGNPANSQDTALANYWQWKLNPSSNDHNLPAASERPNGRRLEDVYINPFSFSMGATTFAKVTISQRSLTYRTDPIKALVAHKTLGETDVAYRLKGFKPAKVYVRTGASATSEPRTSRITRRQYKSYYQEADQGYSMPFGQATDSDTIYSRQRALKDYFNSLNPKISMVTFTPEKGRL